MFSTKTRSTILALVASIGFAATTVAPAISQARPKSPTQKTPTMAEACSAVAGSMLKAEDEAKNYEKKGDTANAEASWAAANLYFDIWSEQGCATVAVVHAPIVPLPAQIVERIPLAHATR
jgi:hypothetical protein